MLHALLVRLNRAICHTIMRLEVRGAANLDRAGPRVVLVPNHVSFLDPPVLSTVLGEVVYAIDRTMADMAWVKPFRGFATSYVIDPEKPMGTRQLIAAVAAGARVVIFPEGRLTVTGGMMKVYDGAAFIADKADAVLVPVHIGGMETSLFTRMPRGLARRRLRPHVTVTIGVPVRLDLPGKTTGRGRREAATATLRAVLAAEAMRSKIPSGSVPAALAIAARSHGRGRPAFEQRLFNRLSYRRFLAEARAEGDRLAGLAPAGGVVAAMLPLTSQGVAAVVGLMMHGRVPFLIDARDGGQVAARIAAAGATVLLTTRAYLEREGLTDIDPGTDVQLAILDELAAGAGAPKACAEPDPDSTALMLPGSDGGAVHLTHRNLLANIAQIRTVTDIGRADRVFACLPLSEPLGFHAGILLPLIVGATAYLHDWPRNPRMLAEYIYLAKPTILFLPAAAASAIGAAAKPEDLRSLRYIFVSDGPVDRATRDLFIDRFGLRILDILATVETLVAAMNTPAAARTGTLGTLLPGVEAVPTGDGRQVLDGPNVAVPTAVDLELAEGFVWPRGAAARTGRGDQAA